ncbi:DEAD/DEAH box helicase [Actinoplanes sp. TBRC 11911]|uniref:DEAD/DEAH box helicase n=1 Tax=Actinoplanes sp. TBRC 11911 TaxID=2729386 RepID=UPI00145DE71C|nr:DEAD/DEAH box helicase [Actinoplanes sp. TBRC 11911]NMO55455.1 DEAD/DEAH box helicase [Actinoplanes sp. TBRC 11911]
MDLTEDEAAIRAAVGDGTFRQARAAVARQELTDIQWSAPARIGYAAVRSGGSSARVTASVVVGADGAVKSVHGVCSCRHSPRCAHPTALVLTALAGHSPRSASWESSLEALVDAPDEAPVAADLALQFDVESAEDGGAPRIGLRPVVPGKRGWVRTGVTWGSLQYVYRPSSRRAERHVGLLTELYSLADADHTHGYTYYGADLRVLYLDQFGSRRVWDVLAEARDTGLPMVRAGKTASPVTVLTQPVRFSVRVDRVDAGLRLRPVLAHGDEVIDPATSIALGRPAHGVAWWADEAGLRLAPTARPISVATMEALSAPAIVVPEADESRFLRTYYPGLARRGEVVSLDEAAALPGLAPATLTLTARFLRDNRMSLTWEWVTRIGAETLREPLHAGHDDDRAALLRRATELVAAPAYGMIETFPDGRRLLASVVLGGDAMLRVVREVFPALDEADGLDVLVRTEDGVPGYVEEPAAPVVSFASEDEATPGAHPDWFDLAVRVSVGGEAVAFEGLFIALAAGQEFMILPSGRYFKLDQPEFRKLHELIAESRELQDAPPGVLRVGRFQAGVWGDLSEVGEVAGQAAAWQESVRALGATSTDDPPSGLAATLRSYQLHGFRWLATLYQHRLGGVLADDMGLGKTIQTLALMCHARAGEPFLVVAPASVVANWAHEAARFAPELAVRTVVQTAARRPESLASVVGGAQVVVTSYTLFRLEYDAYAALPWAGLILDEAQFAKNVQSQNYRCAKQLPVAFKLAITGTPMENNLSELWALLSITAPGLLPRLDRFTDYYRKPIERERDKERLAQLRRRIRPLMLRRRKTEVARELPAKQEQIVELPLNPKHRRIYQTYLQRERQKVLGLLGDLQRNRFEIFRSLTLLRQASLDVALIDPEHEGVASTKLDALVERVTDVVAEGHRILVFSQFTRFLSAARQRLESTGIECAYLDGKTRNRAQVIDGFKAGGAPVFLVSLKSGGFGLNLTEADYCVLLDPWWNPATEAQAVDRVHRIGQTRKVMVYRFVAKDTIEEKVMALQARKAELFGSVLDGGDFASAELTAADIRSLLE